MTSENENMWEEGTVVQKEFPDGVVYGKIAVSVHRTRIEGGWIEKADPPRVILLAWTNIPNELRKEYWKGIDPDDGWSAVPEKHYMWIREKVMGIIEHDGSICDVECDNQGREDCHPTDFSIDNRDDVFQLIYEALGLHMRKFEKPSNWPASDGGAADVN